MIKCRDAARLISESQERPLRLGERVGLRVHLLLCRFCARYSRQVRLLKWLCERVEEADDEPSASDVELASEARERIKARLRK
jgi:hypothetical protein